MGRLAGIVEKTRRAEADIDEARTMAKRFLDKHPYGLSRQFSPDGSEIWVTLNVDEPPPFDKMAVALGLAVHGLRSTLDQLIWALTVQRQGCLPEEPVHRDCWWKHVGFPIFASPWSSPHPPGCRGIRRDLWPQIRDIQPLPTGQGSTEIDGLMLLQELWNWDKHRAVPIVLSPLRYKWNTKLGFLEGLYGVDQGFRPVYFRRVDRPIADGDVVMKLAITGAFRSDLDVDDYLRAHGKFTLDMRFQPGPPGHGAQFVTAVGGVSKRAAEAILLLMQYVTPGPQGGYPHRACPPPCRPRR